VPLDVEWVVARDDTLRDTVASGRVPTTPDADGTVHVDVTGLRPGTTYFYGFRALMEDVQRLHAALPVIATLDDHEFADGAWHGGATEHRREYGANAPVRVSYSTRGLEAVAPVRSR